MGLKADHKILWPTAVDTTSGDDVIDRNKKWGRDWERIIRYLEHGGIMRHIGDIDMRLHLGFGY